RGGDRCVSEQLLHHAHVCAAFEQVRGERVPQRVRGNVGFDPCALGGDLQYVPRTLPRQPSPASVEEQRGRRAEALGARRERRTGTHQIRLDGIQRGPTDRDQTLFATLSVEHHGSLVRIKIVHVEPDGLGDPRTRGVQQLQQCPVAQRELV